MISDKAFYFVKYTYFFSILVLHHHLDTFKDSKKLDRLILTFINTSHTIKKNSS